MKWQNYKMALRFKVDEINWVVVFKGELLQLLRTNHCHVSDI